MSTIAQTDQFHPDTAGSLNLLYEATGTISEKTAALVESVTQKQLRFQQLYDHLRHSLHTLRVEPQIYSSYKQSISLLYNIYQNELSHRSLTPDLTTVRNWARIMQHVMTQEIAGKYLQNSNSIAQDESSNTLLNNTFSGYLLETISSVIPACPSTESIQSKSFPMYTDYFNVSETTAMLH